MANYDTLFRPIKFGNVELKNRFYMLPMSTEYTENYHITDRMIDFYGKRARGGVSLIPVGTMMVSNFYGTQPQYPSQPGATGIWDDEFVPELRKLTEAIHEGGAKACAQLEICYEWRACEDDPLESVGPSDGPGGPFVKHLRELSIDEIKLMIEMYGDAAKRAVDAGFDVIQIHAGVGYMVNRFLSSFSNKRTDEYGGDVEKRAKFLLDIIANCKAKIGPEVPIMVRLGVECRMPGGNTIEDSKVIAKLLEDAGVVALDVQAGFHESPSLCNQFVPDGSIVDLAAQIKQVVSIPVIAGYRIDDPALCEDIVSSGKADMVGMGRQFIADGEYVNKLQEGHPEQIRRCIVCSRCLDGVFVGKGLSCSVNAEIADAAKIEPADVKKRVAIVGAGPAGMEAARVAALRGHEVILIEKEARLGGSLCLASILNERLSRVVDWYRLELSKLPIDIRLNTYADKAMIDSLNADVVVVAPGGNVAVPQVPGIDGQNVLSGNDIKALMAGKATKKGLLWKIAAFGAKPFAENRKMMRTAMAMPWPIKKDLVIIGGGFAGCELAEALADGRNVTIVEPSKRLGSDIGMMDRATELNVIKKKGVKSEVLTQVKSVSKDGVSVVDAEGNEKLIPCKSVMIGTGAERNSALYDALGGEGSALLIGDAVGDKEIRRTKEAIRDGYRVGVSI